MTRHDNVDGKRKAVQAALVLSVDFERTLTRRGGGGPLARLQREILARNEKDFKNANLCRNASSMRMK